MLEKLLPGFYILFLKILILNKFFMDEGEK
jgi:hypothetical protein